MGDHREEPLTHLVTGKRGVDLLTKLGEGIREVNSDLPHVLGLHQFVGKTIESLVCIRLPI